MSKLTKEKILSISELSKTKRVHEIAEELGVSLRCITYWIKRLRERGHEVHTFRGGSKIIL